MSANIAELERPIVNPEIDGQDVRHELGALAIDLAEEFGRPSPVTDGVVWIDRYVVTPLNQMTTWAYHVRRNGKPDFTPSALRYYNLRLRMEDKGWKFGFIFEANPDLELPKQGGATPGASSNDADRPWMNEDAINRLDNGTARNLLYGLRWLKQDLTS